MKSEKPKIKRYTDRWGGKNYGCYPINTPGQSIKDKLDSSKLWELIKTENFIDERNDNQCDIHRGSDYSFKNIDTGNRIDIYMKKSRSGKTVDWEFHCYFDEDINF